MRKLFTVFTVRLERGCHLFMQTGTRYGQLVNSATPAEEEAIGQDIPRGS